MRTYLVHEPGARRDETARALGDDVVVSDDLAGLGDPAAGEPGLVVLDPEAAGLDELLEWLEGRPGTGWLVALLAGGEPPGVRALSLDSLATLEEAGAFARDPEGSPGTLLDLGRVLEEVARVRHDVNNPLTSALAEVQILLMDVDDPEARESLDVVQEQLRRIRDLVAATKHLRPSRD